MSLSTLISHRRKELGLTLREIGKAAGVNKATACRWENGEIRHVRTDKVVKLARVLQMDPMKVLEEIIRENHEKG